MDDYAYVNGKKLRKGFTTGTCATAATAAAISMILNQDIEEKVTVSTANGVEVTMDIKDPSFGELTASAAVEKDGGDDADATHGLLIYSTVTLLPDSNDIEIDGGEGVGRVTQKGLKCDVGMAAINPTPRAMIEKTARQLLGPNCGAKIIISVPGGEETAKLTYNSRLGIVGGISILGTTGIVNPMSEESWKASITIELTMLYNQGYRSVVLAPGNYGEDFATNVLGIPPHRIVNMSNFVGHVLKEVQRIGFTRVLMVGHMGKFVKVAGGIFSTHSKDSDARMEIIMANLALLGAPVELLEKVDQCITTDAAGTLIEEYHYEEVYQVLVDKMKFRSERLLRNRKPEVSIDVVTFGTEAGYLASTQTLEEIAEEWT
ncbi:MULTISPECIES: cobalt-precorrin-5B (C(1))-methyltransferase CbiD [Streptococcus]|jgi:cobalamin biosynthesis protein cbiD|uniref:Cobalt-precorrin-5B C(1)-methyltransferase n=1 Tax=Streptococcus parasanguinis TaxID=1318 RepID=A0A414CKR1_STRPA|nr:MULTISPECIES: cobalt-precorrin-5B (C(1))-methyltransferase CbiD [Streptococcus]AGY38323.1 cobalt-precorrin-6A synthase [Streptococcus ilei]MBZ2091163.1 cobalt-precorrin-5B (C(1))-methyltransferase CbiD [Streptococcus parasanguinis]MDB8650013.1 cobalt-precorrin-5B (C(1))-methyltransferase CbiD [Streptococcus australis]RHC95619.1 cobalt-precorrin-5B (C(1))-methyltransferase [Streptococcus parasanguinis]